MARAIVNVANGGIGDVRPAMLTEVQFQAQNGPGWILADGRNVAGSKYTTLTGNSTVPDIRGVAIRGKNNGRVDGNQDPDGERTLGAFQNDAFQGHEHLMNGLNNTGAQPDALVVTGARTLHNYAAFTGGQTQNNKTVGALQPDANGNGTPRLTTETRMRNVVVNYFIRIN